MRSLIRSFQLALVGLTLSAVAAPAFAQLEPPSTGGIVALEQELRMLGHNKRVLMIGAHPDDEDTELLTLLVRGMGAEAAYLSLNRGEGGQNLIGSELGEGLGLIRTEELLAARRLDGARQFFTRAYDFGYSKTLEETWRFWPRDSVLKDVVRIVREFRPQVIVSIFSGTPRDGHGQHQAAGWAAREVFRIAGDSSQFPGVGYPWTPFKLYRSTRFDSAATTLALDGGVLDPVVGQSYRQIAMRGRSLHRTQDMGQLQRLGPSQVRLQLLENRTSGAGAGLWEGIDTTLSGIRLLNGSSAGFESDHVGSFDVDIGGQLSLARLESSLAALDSILRGFIVPVCPREACYLLNIIERDDQLRHLSAARAITSGLVLDAIASDDRVIPGQAFVVAATVWNTSSRPYWVYQTLQTTHQFCTGFQACSGGRRLIPAGALDTVSMNLLVPDTANFAQPYFMVEPRLGGLYQWPAGSPSGQPFENPDLQVVVDVGSDSMNCCRAFQLRREVSYRTNDQASGEVRRPVIIVPRVDVKIDPGIEVWSTAPDAHAFEVILTHGARDSTSGTVTVEVPTGWPEVQPQRFAFTREDERESFRFAVRPPAGLKAGKYELRAVATDARGRRYDRGVYTVDYPHIRPRSWTQASAATVNVAPLDMARLTRVGYIRGASDLVPEALASVGVPIELLDRTTLERGDLSRFDAIVVGSRAYETDSALVENNARLLAYARNGGLVIVQYQQQTYFNGGFAPFPLTVGGQIIVLDSVGGTRVGPLIGHDRVTDETAPVRLLDPASPVVNRPNKIGPEDWNGWVQERGLYFAHTWDPGYHPLLEMADPGEAPLRGGLLIARYGRGTYVYTGLSFFRELPAGVPGAFRLFANLLALGESAVP